MNRLRAMRGLAVVEFALMLPVMLVLLFMVIEFGRAILARQVLTNLSREGANLTARGTPLADAREALNISAAPLDIGADGYVILTQVFRDSAGNLVIQKQDAGGGRPRPSRVGAGVGTRAVLPPTAMEIPPRGQSLFVTEVFYRHDTLTPLTQLINVGIGDTFYDVAFF